MVIQLEKYLRNNDGSPHMDAEDAMQRLEQPKARYTADEDRERTKHT